MGKQTRKGKALLRVVASVALATAALAAPLHRADARVRRAALFSSDAGWPDARTNHVPIRVEYASWLEPGLKYWNDLAGWNLLVFGEDPQITAKLYRSCSYCALLTYENAKWSQPYQSCDISIAPDARREKATIVHELGHCLGLRHQTFGVMSPASGRKLRTRWRRFDRRLIREAGYAVSADVLGQEVEDVVR